MKRSGIAVATIGAAVLAWGAAVAEVRLAQATPGDYVRIGEAVDRALGPNALLEPPLPPSRPPLSPLPPPPVWLWRQPFDQQPFFATRPGGPGGAPCIPVPGLICP